MIPNDTFALVAFLIALATASLFIGFIVCAFASMLSDWDRKRRAA